MIVVVVATATDANMVAMATAKEKQDLPSPNVARIDGVTKDALVVLGSDEPRVAVLLQEQEVDVAGCDLKGVPGRVLHGSLCGLHGFAVDVDFGLGSRGKKFAERRHYLEGLHEKGQDMDLLPDLFDLLPDLGLVARTVAKLLDGQPESQVFVAVLFLHVLHQLSHSCAIQKLFLRK